jgi:glutaredoxin
MDKVNELIAKHEKDVFFFGKDGCKYCDMLEADMKSMDIPFTKLKLGEAFDQDVSTALKERLQYTTFPMLFFGPKFVGGYSAFQQLCYTGKLQTRLADELGIQVEYDF